MTLSCRIALAALVLAGSSAAAAALPVNIKGGVDSAFLGDGLCGAWQVGAVRSAEDDAKFSYVLGFLSARDIHEEELSDRPVA